MNSKERFYSTIEYRGYDRPPTKHYGTPEINNALMHYLGIFDYERLLEKVGDDFRHIRPLYAGPELKTYEDGSWEGYWGERYINFAFGNGTYPEAIYLPFANVESVEELKDIRFPSPDWFNYSNIKRECERNKEYVIAVGDAGIPDFINGIARCRGVEKVLYDIALEDPVYLKLVDKRYEFFYEMYKRVFEAAEGMIDVLCLGEDLGNQNGLMISPASYDKLFAPYMKEFIDLAHKYGSKAMMHSCGSCYGLLPKLIDMGLDILEVIQVDAAGMDIKELHKEFYGKIAFCGSISVQSTLPFGTEEEVIQEVELRRKLFKDGGMIIAATHDIQVGTPLSNILAMYRAIGSLALKKE